MSTGSDTYNTDINCVPKDGGAIAVTIASKVGQGNDGTSQPCKRVYVQGAISNASYTMMNINAAATSVLGIGLPNGGGMGTSITVFVSTQVTPPPMVLEIDDVNKLYFWNATDGDIVNILYRR